MASSNSHSDKLDNGRAEASLFEAISHETRIRILFLLRDHALGFSELKNQLEIKSSGNLQHHLGKLGTLIHFNEEGLYSLTDSGKEAIMAIRAVRRTQNRQKSDRIVITLVYAFSFYIAFMNVPFLLGTVNAQTPLFALSMAGFMSMFIYLVWPLNLRRSQDYFLNEIENNMPEASLFGLIAHETRIRVLFLLQEDSLGFSDLKRKLGLTSSGNLQHHINKLGILIEQNEVGKYTLADSGTEAVMAIQAIRSMQNRLKTNLNVMIIVGTLIFYIVQLTTPFLLGTVNSLTPVDALVGSIAFGVCFYIIWSAAFKVIINKKAESSTWIREI